MARGRTVAVALYKFKYEEASEDELESVVNLSSCKIVKDKKGVFSNKRWFGSNFHHGHKNANSPNYRPLETREKRVSLSTEASDENSDPEKEDLDYDVLKDVSDCVVSFLEEGEPEPSDGETISSTSTTSYETILSDYNEDTAQDSNSQEDVEFTNSGKPEEENIYDEIDGGSSDGHGEVIHIESPEEFRLVSMKGHGNAQSNAKIVHRRLDETFTVEGHAERERMAPMQGSNRHLRDFVSKHANISEERYCAQYSDLNRQYSGPNTLKASERINVKRVTTEFTPFSDADRGDLDQRFVNRKSPFPRKQGRTGCSNEHDAVRENTMFSSLNSEESTNTTKEMNGMEGNTEHSTENLVNLECLDKRNLIQSVAERPHYDWLSKRFSPAYRSNQKVISNDLSPSQRKRGSRKLSEQFKNISVEHGSPSSHREKESIGEINDAIKMVTPFHHRQAKKMIASNFKQASLQEYEFNSNETDYESLQEENRSSKKDSGFSTMHDESLITDTPLYEEVQEILTLENLDSFNKSLAEQSSFVNVSVNCSDCKVDEQSEKVEQWLQNVSVEMEKETETTIDRKVDRITKEVYGSRKYRPNAMVEGVEGKIRENDDDFTRHRQSSAEIAKNCGKIYEPLVSRSCQPLTKLQESYISTGRMIPASLDPHNEKSRQDYRHVVKGHRNSGQLFPQKLGKQNIADLLKMFGKKKIGESGIDEVSRSRHSEYSGKRLIETPNDIAYSELNAEMPTPPKSRRLSENMNSQIQQNSKNRNFDLNSGKNKSPRHVKSETGIKNYIENDLRDEYDPEKQAVFAYMVPRSFSRQSLPCRSEIAEVRQTRDKKTSQEINRRDKPLSLDRRTSSQYELPRYVFAAAENSSERDKYCNIARNEFERKIKSPTREARLKTHQDVESTQRDRGDLLSPNSFKRTQYEVSQSYVRKLKQTPEDGHENEKHYAQIVEEIDEEYDRFRNLNDNRYRNEQVQGHDIEYDELAIRRGCYHDYTNDLDHENSRHRNLHSVYNEQIPKHDHYPDAGGDILYDKQARQGRNHGDDKKLRNRRKSSDKAMLVSYGEARKDSQERNYTVKGVIGRSPQNLENSFSNFADREDEYDNILPRSEMERIHMECHLGSPRRQMSRHISSRPTEAQSPSHERNNIGLFRVGSSPYGHMNDRNRDFEIGSPSSRQDMEVKYGDFSSPIVERAKQSKINKQDEYSPSASLARMKLNTPKSKSKDRQKQYRNGERQGETPYSINESLMEKKYRESERQIETQYTGKERQIEKQYKGKERQIENRYRGNEGQIENQYNRGNERQLENQYRGNERKIENQYRGNERQIENRYEKNERQLENQYRGNERQIIENQYRGNELRKEIQNRDSGTQISQADRNNNHPEELFYAKNIRRDESHVPKNKNKNLHRRSPKHSEYESNYPETEENKLVEATSPNHLDQLSPRFVSLDQISGMPLQLRIQQLEYGHTERNRRNSKGRQAYGNTGCSNEYITENSNKDSTSYDYIENEKPVLERRRNSNVYHKYCEVMNENDKEYRQKVDNEGSEDDIEDDNTNAINTHRSTNEPKMRKNLFSPSGSNFKPLGIPQDQKTGLHNNKDLDVFKTPMSPPVVARSKVNKHNKENELDKKKVSQQNARMALRESAKARDKLSSIHANSGRVKMTSAQYMQSTPIKPGIQFSLNTTMSTIMGSDETEINNDVDEEIILI